MNRLSSSLRVSAACACFGAALIILWGAGLPERADYSGYLTRGLGFVAPEPGETAPPFALYTPSGERIALEELRAEIIVLNFWATWCRPCRAEHRHLQRLADENRGDMRVLAINLGEDRASVARWIEELNLSIDVLLDPTLAVARLYHAPGAPATFMLDARHRIVDQRFGPLRVADLDSLLRRGAASA